jgi:hypothetical protein
MNFKTVRDINGLPILTEQQNGGTSDLVFDRQGRNIGLLSAQGTRDASGRLISPDRESALLRRRNT